MVGMPLLNLGYGLSGLTQGYNQAQQQAMQLAAQRLALQQAQSQQNAQRLASQYLQSPGFKGFGGGFNPANIQPIGGQQAPIPGVTTPSQAPAPPIAQQPPSASPPDNGSAPFKIGGPYYPGSAYPTAPSQDDAPDSSLKDPQTIPLDEPSDKPATSASPVTTTPDTKPAPGPSSDAAPSSTAPSTAPATTSDASGADSGEGYAIKIPGGPSIPMSQFFGSVDYGHLAQGIAKIAPPGTDQADIYQAVVDLSKLAEGNKTQQQQAGLILRELIKQPFELQKVEAQGNIRKDVANIGAASREKVANIGATSRETVGAAHDATRLQVAQLQQQTQTLNRDARQANFLANQGRLTKNHQDQLDHQFAVLQNTAAQLGYREISLRMSAIRGEVSTIKGTAGTFSQEEQARLAKLDAEFAALAAKIQPSPAAPQAAPAPAAQ